MRLAPRTPPSRARSVASNAGRQTRYSPYNPWPRETRVSTASPQELLRVFEGLLCRFGRARTCIRRWVRLLGLDPTARVYLQTRNPGIEFPAGGVMRRHVVHGLRAYSSLSSALGGRAVGRSTIQSALPPHLAEKENGGQEYNTGRYPPMSAVAAVGSWSCVSKRILPDADASHSVL